MSEFNPDWTSPPGDTICDLKVERDLPWDWLRSKLGLSAQGLDWLLDGILPIDEDLACDLENYLGGTKDFWLAREENFRHDVQRLAYREEK